MMNYSIIALFCEHIRRESGGAETLIGILPDNVGLPSVPFVLPSLSVYVRIHLNNGFDPGTLSISLLSAEKAVIASQEIERQLIDQVLASAKQSGTAVAGIVSRLNFRNFEIPAFGRMTAQASVGQEEIVCGVLNVVATEHSGAIRK